MTTRNHSKVLLEAKDNNDIAPTRQMMSSKVKAKENQPVTKKRKMSSSCKYTPFYETVAYFPSLNLIFICFSLLLAAAGESSAAAKAPTSLHVASGTITTITDAVASVEETTVAGLLPLSCKCVEIRIIFIEARI